MPLLSQPTAQGILESLDDHALVLAIPGTDYRLQLVPAGPAAALRASLGKRIAGTIEAAALRIHPAGGGGTFIEPVYGPPRIVAGRVRQIDRQGGRVLIESAVPMWVRWPSRQKLDVLQEGLLVNFYVESGATFTPARPA